MNTSAHTTLRDILTRPVTGDIDIYEKSANSDHAATTESLRRDTHGLNTTYPALPEYDDSKTTPEDIKE